MLFKEVDRCCILAISLRHCSHYAIPTPCDTFKEEKDLLFREKEKILIKFQKPFKFRSFCYSLCDGNFLKNVGN